MDPVRCSVNYVLSYLGELFEKGRQYRTIGCHRSAISAFHDNVDGRPVGQHPKVSDLLKGVFNKKTPQPRYTFTWDVQVVLDYIKANWSQTETLTNKLLTYKLVMLMALASASRASSIHCLDVRFKSESHDRTTFKFARLHKGWKIRKSPPKLDFYKFTEDKDFV